MLSRKLAGFDATDEFHLDPQQDSSEEESDAGPSRQASGSTQRKRGRPSTQNRRDADSDEDSDDAGGATQTQLKGKGKQTADKLTSQVCVAAYSIEIIWFW